MTGLDVVVPQQKERLDADVEAFRSGALADGGNKDGDKGGKGEPTGKGSILAWLGHMDVLEWYVSFSFLRLFVQTFSLLFFSFSSLSIRKRVCVSLDRACIYDYSLVDVLI